MTAAQVLIDALTWMDHGGDERRDALLDTMLRWKGRRLRDALGGSSLRQLERRVEQLHGTPSRERLERLTLSAGMLLNGDDLERFLDMWGELPPPALEALGPLVRLLPQRQDRKLSPAGHTLLMMREELPEEPERVTADGALAEHLYRVAILNRPIIASLRGWFKRHAAYRSPARHRVAQSAALAGHWDVVEAFFEAGSPQSQPDTVADSELASFLYERAREYPGVVARLTRTAATRPDQDNGFMRAWCSTVASGLSEDPDPEARQALVDALAQPGVDPTWTSALATRLAAAQPARDPTSATRAEDNDDAHDPA